jgi:hypothetical protein
MREMNTIHSFIDDSEFHETQNDAIMAVENSQITSNTNYLNINNEKCADSGIVYDPDEVKNSSKFSINSHEDEEDDEEICNNETLEERRKSLLNRRREFNDSGIDSIPKISISSTRDFFSKQSLSIKSSSVSTVAVPLRDIKTSSTVSKIRSKRYSLPDIDKLKAYNDIKSGKRAIRKITQCDTTTEIETQTKQLPLVPTEAKLIPLASEKLDNFNIDPKLINKYDGLCQSLYYIDENGSPKIRERYINQQRMIIERQEAKKREKQAKKELDAQNGTTTCSCFSFSRFTKKLKELCK